MNERCSAGREIRDHAHIDDGTICIHVLVPMPSAYEIVGRVVRVGKSVMLEDAGGALWNAPGPMGELAGKWVRIIVTETEAPEPIVPTSGEASAARWPPKSS